jgi:hypothetical protein
MRSYTRVNISKFRLYKVDIFRTCTKKLMGNVPRLDESSWSLTSVDSKILKWSPNAVKWPVGCFHR